MSGVTTTTLSVVSTSHNLARLTPTTGEMIAPLLAFAVVATIMGFVAIRRRLGH
jgi:hypothetical protein